MIGRLPKLACQSWSASVVRSAAHMGRAKLCLFASHLCGASPLMGFYRASDLGCH